MTPTARIAVGIAPAPARAECQSEPERDRDREQHAKLDRMRRRSHRTDEAIAVGFDGAVEVQKWKDRADMVEDVEADPLLDDRKHGYCRRARDEELRQVLDRAPAPNDRDE